MHTGDVEQHSCKIDGVYGNGIEEEPNKLKLPNPKSKALYCNCECKCKCGYWVAIIDMLLCCGCNNRHQYPNT